MVRKGTALILLWLMTVVVATSQPGLTYCLCLQQVLVGECSCRDLVEEETCSQECSCDCSSQETPEIDEEPHAPCQDCLQSLWLDLDDFVGTDSPQTSSHEGDNLQTSPEQFGEIDTTAVLISSSYGIRGSPPPIAGLIPSVSLRVRYSVFLI